MLRARSVAGLYWPCAFSVRAIAIAPWWCAIIMVRNSRSNADPVKPWSIPISASLIIPYGEVVPPMPGDGLPPIPDVDPIGPGVMPGTGLPPIPDVDPIGRAAQGPEITTMTGWLTSWGQPTAVPSTTARPMGSTSGMGGSPVPGMTPDPMGSTSGMGGSPSPGMGGTTSPYGMMSDAEMGMLQGLTESAFDREFLTMMIAHHQGAIAIARTEKAQGQYRPATDLARSIETSQTGEVTEMQTLLAQI